MQFLERGERYEKLCTHDPQQTLSLAASRLSKAGPAMLLAVKSLM